MRICKICKKEKELEKFRKRIIWFSHTCKECYTAQYRTGKPNLGKFIKGQVSWNKGKKDCPRRDKPRYVKKGRELKSLYAKRSIWSRDVKTRDGYKCLECGSEKNIQAHHIIPWKECEEKRFDMTNGKTLCSKCHMKEERLMEISKGIRQKDGFGKIKVI
jgi:5-methylcytosine-specific restriction endonuclease McrA